MHMSQNEDVSDHVWSNWSSADKPRRLQTRRRSAALCSWRRCYCTNRSVEQFWTERLRTLMSTGAH